MSRSVMIVASMTGSDITRYAPRVPRWKPEAQSRLIVAALDLFEAEGFERTTVAEIAGRAQLTERTFYRYFDDKREVLFAGTAHLEELLVDEIAAAPMSATALETVIDAMKVIAENLQDQREFGLRRSAVIAASPELQERELIKIAHLARTAATALVRRGVGDTQAWMAAEAAAMVFKSAFDRWAAAGATTPLPTLMDDAYSELCELTNKDRSTP